MTRLMTLKEEEEEEGEDGGFETAEGKMEELARASPRTGRVDTPVTVVV